MKPSGFKPGELIGKMNAKKVNVRKMQTKKPFDPVGTSKAPMPVKGTSGVPGTKASSLGKLSNLHLKMSNLHAKMSSVHAKLAGVDKKNLGAAV